MKQSFGEPREDLLHGMKNIHTHTHLCNHASGTPEDYAAEAYRLGYSLLGFSDHAPYLFPDGYYSYFRMLPDEAEEYAKDVLRLKNEYRGKMDIRLGFETEYYPAHFDKTLAFLKSFGTDYLLLGQHFTNNEYDGIYASSTGVDRKSMDRYADQTIEAMETGEFICLAHPDLLNGDPDYRYRCLLRILTAAQRLNIPAEINLLGLSSGRHYPSTALLRAAADSGCKIVIGVDAHNPSALNCPESYQKALDMISEFELNFCQDIF